MFFLWRKYWGGTGKPRKKTHKMKTVRLDRRSTGPAKAGLSSSAIVCVRSLAHIVQIFRTHIVQLEFYEKPNPFLEIYHWYTHQKDTKAQLLSKSAHQPDRRTDRRTGFTHLFPVRWLSLTNTIALRAIIGWHNNEDWCCISLLANRWSLGSIDWCSFCSLHVSNRWSEGSIAWSISRNPLSSLTLSS